MKKLFLSVLLLSSLSLMSNETSSGDDKISVENLTEKEFSAYLDGKKSGDDEIEWRDGEGEFFRTRTVKTIKFNDEKEKLYFLMGYHCALGKWPEKCQKIEEAFSRYIDRMTNKLESDNQTKES